MVVPELHRGTQQKVSTHFFKQRCASTWLYTQYFFNPLNQNCVNVQWVAFRAESVQKCPSLEQVGYFPGCARNPMLTS